MNKVNWEFWARQKRYNRNGRITSKCCDKLKPSCKKASCAAGEPLREWEEGAAPGGCQGGSGQKGLSKPGRRP